MGGSGLLSSDTIDASVFEYSTVRHGDRDGVQYTL